MPSKPRKPAADVAVTGVTVELTGAIVAHVPTLNVGVIAATTPDGCAFVEWNTDSAPETTSTVPLTELVLNPAGVTLNADVAELVATMPTIVVPGSPLVQVPAPDVDAEPTADGGAKVTPRRPRRRAADPAALGDADLAVLVAESAAAADAIVLGGRAVRAAGRQISAADRLAAIGDEPGNKAGREKFAKYTEAQRTRIRRAAAKLYGEDNSRTVAQCWADALAAAPEPPAPPAPRTATATSEHGDVAGYVLIKSRRDFDQFRKEDPAADGAEWLARCNAHGTTAEAANRRDSRTIGSAAKRAEWCPPCKQAAELRAAAADATAEHDAAEKSS